MVVSPSHRRQKRKVDQQSPPSVQLKNVWSYTAPPAISLHDNDSDKFNASRSNGMSGFRCI